MVCATVLEHPTYQRVVKLLETQVGRDKLMRTVQYFARFLSYFLFRKGYPKSTVLYWRHVMSTLSQARKLFRLGKPLSHVKAAVGAYGNKNADPVLRATTVLRNLGTTGFLTFDSLLWLHQAKLRPLSGPSARQIQVISLKFWLFSLVAGLVNSGRRYYQAKQRESALRVEGEKDVAIVKKVVQEEKDATQQFLLFLLDSFIPLAGLQWVNFDDGFVGLAGTITSVAGLRAVW